MSGAAMPFAYIRDEAKAGRMGVRLMAIVAEGKKGRIYLTPTKEMDDAAIQAKPTWRPDVELPLKHRNFQTPGYGLTNLGDLFTDRQLVALTTFSELIQEAELKATASAIDAGLERGEALDQGGSGALAYGQAIAVYLAFALSKLADRGSSICTWFTERDSTRNTFARQAIPMTWDFAELNTLLSGSGSFLGAVQWTAESVEGLVVRGDRPLGGATQANASTQVISTDKVISTDPPYYDNISYADLSDFFYVWLRKTLRPIFPDLFATKAVPKMEELVATPTRHGGKGAAEKFFLEGMTEAMHRLSQQAHPAFPTTIYYAFKQSDTTDVGTGNTGWETFLEAVLRAGFSITGTWPMRTELSNRMVGMGANALASSIVLVCRPRDGAAPSISRRDFLRELKEELAEAVEAMIGGSEGVSPVAPVDLAQAVIGPGMAIFSKYSAVLEADGSPMTVHTALTLINRMLTEGADDFDADTQFCLGWFDEQGWSSGEFGQATVLARAKGTSVDGVKEAGVAEAASGLVRLLRPIEYPADWLPSDDNGTPVWEALHQMIRALRSEGESVAGQLLAGMPQRADPIRNLAYRLYTLCERKGWAEDARAYNELITSWTGIEAASHEKGHLGSQTKFDI
jgi:putative DNA methylase